MAAPSYLPPSSSSYKDTLLFKEGLQTLRLGLLALNDSIKRVGL